MRRHINNYMFSSSLLGAVAILCADLAVASPTVTPAHVPDIEDAANALEAVCPLTDPLCREIAELPGILGPQNSARARTGSARNRRSQNAGNLRAPRRAILPAAQATRPAENPATPTTPTPGVRVQVRGNQTVMNFDGDDVSGHTHHVSDQRVVGHLGRETQSCFSTHLTPVRQGLVANAASSRDQLAIDSAWDQTLHCLYPCMDDGDRRTLLACLKEGRSSCMEVAIAHAQAEHRYSPDFQVLAATGACAQAPAWATRIQAEVERTHECPSTPAQIEVLRAYAEQKVRDGYDPTNVPAPGSIRVCGYNESLEIWFNTQGQSLSATSILGQGGSRYPLNCMRLARSDSNAAIWHLASRTCTGEVSYRSGGNLGDMRLIPLSRNVWVQTFFQPSHAGGRPYYHGLLIGNPRAE